MRHAIEEWALVKVQIPLVRKGALPPEAVFCSSAAWSLLSSSLELWWWGAKLVARALVTSRARRRRCARLETRAPVAEKSFMTQAQRSLGVGIWKLHPLAGMEQRPIR
jgi:hypothetical protein